MYCFNSQIIQFHCTPLQNSAVVIKKQVTISTTNVPIENTLTETMLTRDVRGRVGGGGGGKGGEFMKKKNFIVSAPLLIGTAWLLA